MAEPIYTVCKYSPVELLAGFDLETERLDPHPVAFSCSDGCAHPNLCGYGKAVLETVLTQGIRRLLLVDCCDVCRRVYDVLREEGNMEFLYLLPLPHKNGAAELERMERELRKLHAVLTIVSSKAFAPDKALAAWEAAAVQESVTAPHITFTGAHGGSLLFDTLRERSGLAVVDETCTGRRLLEMPRDIPDEDAFFRAYSEALLCQAKPCMRMQFRLESADPDAVGVICHTMKFCDYYGFQYAALRKNTEVPLLKIETDATPQSGGQLRTRLDAFVETVRPQKKLRRTENAAAYVAGVDSGSASTDAVILDRERRIVGSAILPTGAGAGRWRRRCGRQG